jgi:hypothetical protein
VRERAEFLVYSQRRGTGPVCLKTYASRLMKGRTSWAWRVQNRGAALYGITTALEHLEFYSREVFAYLHHPPASRMGMVGVVLPDSGSIVIANALACKSFGKVGISTLALPRASGLKTPTGIGGAPLVGNSQSS